MFVYGCAQFVFMAESRWQMSDVANTWNGHHPGIWGIPPLLTCPDSHTHGQFASNPISLMSPVRRKHFANILSSSGKIRNIYRFAQHITHLISILVLSLSSLGQCPEREYWYNLIGFLSRPTLDHVAIYQRKHPSECQLHYFHAILCNISTYVWYASAH